jgi:septum formation protein
MIDESRLPVESVQTYVERLAVEKAAAIREPAMEAVIGADTTVAIGEQLFGKPENLDVAKSTLLKLQGRRHEVWTGYAVFLKDVLYTGSEMTKVWFRPLSLGEIARYVEQAEPLDKAGAYNIQGEGAALVERVEGSITNVIGLPLEKIAAILRGEPYASTKSHRPS